MTAYDVRSLERVGWDELAAAFNRAFSDYSVPMQLTSAALADMQRRRGYAPAVSFGAFAGDRLVGFALTCTGGGRAYNSGTGVEPAHRRAGLARRLVEAVIARAPGRAYVLEVLEDNARAEALYRALGFVETRRLQCWGYAARPGPPRSTSSTPPAIAELSLAALDELAAAGDAEVEPSWQNTLASVRRAAEPYVVLGSAHGAIAMFPHSADVPFLCVRRAARRRGLGVQLLAAAAARAPRPLRLNNLPDAATGVAAFLTAAGATRTVRQIELVRPLP